jgi:hypothetical protein
MIYELTPLRSDMVKISNYRIVENQMTKNMFITIEYTESTKV